MYDCTTNNELSSASSLSISYIVVDSDNKGTVMTMAVQRSRGMSNEELIEEVTGKIIRYCRTNNVIVYGK